MGAAHDLAPAAAVKSQCVLDYLNDGWTRIYEYDGPDAGIDYVRVHLRRGRTVLRFRWDNIDEGSVSGPRRYIEDIARYVRENGTRRPS